MTCYYFKYSAVKGLYSSCPQVVIWAWLLVKSEMESMVAIKQQPRLLPRVGKFNVGKKSGWEFYGLPFTARGRLWATFHSG